jgi:hypothetical protein
VHILWITKRPVSYPQSPHGRGLTPTTRPTSLWITHGRGVGEGPGQTTLERQTLKGRLRVGWWQTALSSAHRPTGRAVHSGLWVSGGWEPDGRERLRSPVAERATDGVLVSHARPRTGVGRRRTSRCAGTPTTYITVLPYLSARLRSHTQASGLSLCREVVTPSHSWLAVRRQTCGIPRLVATPRLPTVLVCTARHGDALMPRYSLRSERPCGHLFHAVPSGLGSGTCSISEVATVLPWSQGVRLISVRLIVVDAEFRAVVS